MELLLALVPGMGLLGVMLQCLLAQGRNSGQLVRILREKAFQRRALDLVATDLRQATGISLRPEVAEPACPLAGRTPILHLETDAGPITYSFGPAPSAIWRGQVLMRCGPAYGLDGVPSSARLSPNRVVMDGVMSIDPEKFNVKIVAEEQLMNLALAQCFNSPDGSRMIRQQS